MRPARLCKVGAGSRREEPAANPVVTGLNSREPVMDLQTPLDTYCRLILRAKEMEAQVPALDPDDDPENVDDLDDEGDQALSALQDESNEVEEEVRALLDDLAEDQLIEALTLAWIGRGTFDASEWDEAAAEAEALSAGEKLDELMEMPLLASHLEAGLAAFEFDCNAVGQSS